MSRLNFCLAALLVLLSIVAAQETYSDAFDHVDVDEILNNDELRNQYYKCVMDTGPCVTDDQKFLKVHAAEVVATQCKKCTEKQKASLEKISVWFSANAPNQWNDMVKKLLIDATKLDVLPA